VNVSLLAGDSAYLATLLRV